MCGDDKVMKFVDYVLVAVRPEWDEDRGSGLIDYEVMAGYM